MSADSGAGWVRLGNSITYNEIFPVVGANMYGHKNIEIWEDPNLIGGVTSNGSNYVRAINIRRDYNLNSTHNVTHNGYLRSFRSVILMSESGGTSHCVVNIFGNIDISGGLKFIRQISDDFVVIANIFGTVTINDGASGAFIHNSSRSYSVVNIIGNGRIINNSQNYIIIEGNHNRYVNIYDNASITGRIF